MSTPTPDPMKALIADIRSEAVIASRPGQMDRLEAIADRLEAVYDAGRRELAERFANQDKTRKAAIEELMAWEDEHELPHAHPAEETEELLAYKPITADELGSYLTGARPGDQELSVLVPVHVVARAVAALRVGSPAEETVTTVEELEALPVGSALLDVFAAVCVRASDSAGVLDWRRVTTAVRGGEHRHRPYLPARVLYRPVPEGSETP